MPVNWFRGLYGAANSLNNPPVVSDPCTLQMDGAITIGQLPVPLNNAIVLVNATLTDNNAGQANAPDISINVAAAQTAVIPFVMSEYLKEVTAFLSTSSVPALNNSGLYADDTGYPPIPKGTKVTGIEFCYSVTGGALTSLNVRADLVNFSTIAGAAIANANTAMFANTALAAPFLAATASATTCRNAVATFTTPIFDALDASTLYVKISPVTPGGVTFRLYALMLNLTFNYL